MAPKMTPMRETMLTVDPILATPETKKRPNHVPSNSKGEEKKGGRKREFSFLGPIDFTPDRPTKALRSPMGPTRTRTEGKVTLMGTPDSENELVSDLKSMSLKPSATSGLTGLPSSPKTPECGSSVEAHRASPVSLTWPTVGHGMTYETKTKDDRTPDHGRFRRMRATTFENDE